MEPSSYNRIKSVTALSWIAVTLFCIFFSACKHTKSSAIASKNDSVPTMQTFGIDNLISDSGATRYHMRSPQWDVYDKLKEPIWMFPKGIYVERYDSVYDIDVKIKADTGYYYINKKLWELRGHVSIINKKKESFFSDEFFFDQKEEQVYSNKHIVIVSEDGEEKGYGFRANKQMTEYQIFNPYDGLVPISEQWQMDSARVNNPDEIVSDSLPQRKTDEKLNH